MGWTFKESFSQCFHLPGKTFVLVLYLQPILTRKPTSKVGPGIVCSRGCVAAPLTGGVWFRGSQAARGKDCSIGCLAADLSGRAVGR